LKTNGFTLMELMVAIAMGAILMAIAIPSMRGFTISSAVEQAERNTLANIYSARNQSIDLNRDVVVCFANDTDTCVVNGITHLVMFVDTNTDGIRNNGETILLNSDHFDTSVVINTPRDSYRFRSDGILRGNNATIKIYNNEDGCVGKNIILALSGRARTCSSNSASAECAAETYCD
jgi:type IV fimbrial biogenesis protein FimT